MDDTLLLQLIAKVDAISGRLAEPQKTVPREWYSIKEIAQMTGLSGDHVRRHVTGGTLPCTNVGTPSRPLYRISRVDYERFMTARRSGAMSPPKKKGKVQLPYNPHFRAAQQTEQV